MKDYKINNLNIHLNILGSVRTNCYIVSNGTTKEAIVIDPADRADIITEYIKQENLTLTGILLTHGHYDHILAAQTLKNDFHVKIYANKNEKEMLMNSRINFSNTLNMKYEITPDVLLEDSEQLTLAGFHIKAIHTPGHTSGGNCYYFEEENVLFSGDTLFRETVGRTDLPNGSFNAIISSIKEKLMGLNVEVVVFPGHGESTTIGHERVNNVYLDEDRIWE